MAADYRRRAQTANLDRPRTARMKPIVTLTLNSSVDVQWEVPEMEPTRKLRSTPGIAYAGGGGINVSRVIKTLGGQSISVFTAGSFTGHFLREMVDDAGLVTRVIQVQGNTRTAATIADRATGREYRVTPPGPSLTEKEWCACFDALFDIETDYIVATGSLPVGVPDDFYAQVARKARSRDTRVVLDTSGPPLAKALEEGVFMVKPNLRELERLTDADAKQPDAQEALTRRLVDDGRAEVVALTLGAEGALLAWEGGCLRLKGPDVAVKSAVGAGDSFVAGVTYGLARGATMEDAFALGVSTGTAAVITAGSELCRRPDIERVFEEVSGRSLDF
jgi:6-phosphofructokinase 2